MEEIRKEALDRVYGARGVCYVELQKGSFDGLSHQAMHRWCINVLEGDVTDFWNSALGFAIQKDNAGYYIRFASTLNEKLGQSGASPFVERKAPRKDRESRDLPKHWALFVEYVLATQLRLAVSYANSDFERITSRDESQTTKLTRFSIEDPSPLLNHLV